MPYTNWIPTPAVRPFRHRCFVLAWAALLLLAIAATGAATETLYKSPKALPPDPPIRVLLIDSVTSLCVTPKQAWKITTLAGKPLGEMAADQPTTIALVDGEMRLLGAPGNTGAGSSLGREPIALESVTSGGILAIRRVPFGVGWWWASAEDRAYEGRIEICAGPNGKLVVVNVLPLERYLRGVVPSEIGADSPLQALSAQAVAARSAAVLALTSPIYAGPCHDICSDVACQAFSGVSKCTAASDESVTSTRGMILAFEGKPVSAYYASNCGGHTEDIRNVWPERASDRAYWGAARGDGPSKHKFSLAAERGIRKWLAASPDCYCNPAKYQVPAWAAKNFRWTREISADELTSRVALKKDIGSVTSIRPVRRGPSGRLIQAKFVGTKGSLIVGPELAIRQVFDPPLKSAAFVVDTQTTQTAKGRERRFVIRGAGWGHGVGMCQTGAISMARAGIGFPEILAQYFPNAKIEKLY